MVQPAEGVLNPSTAGLTNGSAEAVSHASVPTRLQVVRSPPGMARHHLSWRPPERWPSIFRRRDVQVTLVVVSVVIMLTTSIPTSILISTPSRKQTDNILLTSSQPPYYPYLTSPRAYPSPDNITSPMGPAYFPQLAYGTIANITIYDLAYAVNVSGVGSVLELATGTYNATLAQTIFTTHSCTNSPCTNHLPILWNAPIP